MASKVKKPEQPSCPEEGQLFDKLIALSLKYDKTQFQEALAEIDTLRKESADLKKAGKTMKDFEKELKRQENRHKMDQYDAKALDTMQEEKN